nr:NAD(P)H-binding protein [Euzebyales bacterium]
MTRLVDPSASDRLVLVLGATGYVGGRLVPRLLAAGYRVRCMVRSPGKVAGLPWGDDVEVVRGDLLEDDGLSEAFEGAAAAFHLVHSMGGAEQFAAADRTIARNVVRAAARAHVGRLVYLGGLGDVDEDTSAHLRSRAEVAEILSSSSVPTTVLRAAVVIGSGSASFEMLRHLVEKLPVMITPRWVDTRVQPIAIRDVLRYLVGGGGGGG